MPDVRIIRCGPIFFFTTPMPAGSVSKLLPAGIPDVDADVFGEENYFALLVGYDAPGLPDDLPGDYGRRQEAAVRAAVEYTWQELHRRGAVDSDDMPEWIDGDPADMIVDESLQLERTIRRMQANGPSDPPPSSHSSPEMDAIRREAGIQLR